MVNNKILIIDDEPMVIESICDSLERENYTLFSASNGQQGLEMFVKENPVLIILDLRI